MKNYDILFILVCCFVARIVVFSGSYADALCLVSILAYKASKEVILSKTSSDKLEESIKKNEEINSVRIQALADELVKVKNSAEGLKAAINFTKR